VFGDADGSPPAYHQEGRPAEPVPPGDGAVQLTPPPTGAPGSVQVGTPNASDPKYGGVLYEKNRIKRTVPLDAGGGLDGRWDVLYSYVDSIGGAGQPGGSGVRTVYMDWDDAYLYLAMETPSPTDVRFEIDGRNDGWLHGADNLSIQLSPPAQAGGAPSVTAERFDALQNRDRPVYADSPISATEMKAQAGTTPRGTYAVALAIPRTEAIGLLRKIGTTFGLRVSSGMLPPMDDASDSVSLRPMLRLTLADSVSAQGDGGLELRVGVIGPRTIPPGDDLRLTLDARNAGSEPITLSRLFLRGSLATMNVLDAATYNGIILAPGQRLSRELRSSVTVDAAPGTYVIAGGAEQSDGSLIASLAAFDRVEPFTLDLAIDSRPVDSHSDAGVQRNGTHGWLRLGAVTVVSRVHDRNVGTVRMQLPSGWSLDGGDLNRTVPLRFAGDTQVQYFRIVVPTGVAPGDYPITVSLDVAGHAYSVSRTLTVQ
jgi:hypothetical protein